MKLQWKQVHDLSCDVGKERKNLSHALGVRDLTNDLVDERN